jgi:hypothetical protein
MRQMTSPLLMVQPRTRTSQVDFRLGLPPGPVDLVARIALDTRVYLSVAPRFGVPQLRLLALRISGKNPGHLYVSSFGVTSPVAKDGTFMIRGGGGSSAGGWREMVVGRIEGRRLLLSIYQLELVGDRGRDQPTLACKVLFRGTCWTQL